MSRTALRCFLALGISISLSAACGDDEGGDGSGGSSGNAGNAGSNGMSGSSGASGSAGNGGSAGSAGSSGASGSSGAAGQGGGNGGDGGSSGQGGSAGEEPDGGPDGAVVEEPDASTGGTGGAAGTGGTGGSAGTGGSGGSGSTADCPANQNGIVNANNSQELAIVRVLFDGAGQVVFRNVLEAIEGDAGATTQSLQSVFVCNGPENCFDVSEDGNCTESGDDDGDLLAGEEATCDVPGTLAEVGGELALTNAVAASESSFVRSYVAWGNAVSVPPERDAGTVDSLEVRAEDGDFWTLGDRVAAPTGTQDAIFATGSLIVETGYTVCTQD